MKTLLVSFSIGLLLGFTVMTSAPAVVWSDVLAFVFAATLAVWAFGSYRSVKVLRPASAPYPFPATSGVRHAGGQVGRLAA